MRRHIPRIVNTCGQLRKSAIACQPVVRISQIRPTLNQLRLFSSQAPIAPVAPSSSSSSSTSSLFTPQGDKPFYITTPIFYVNAAPHIGHLHSLLLVDVISRFARLRHPDRNVVFATGTDEHGMKIQQAAKAKGVDEQTFCDSVSQRFRDLAILANASNTDFIRTTEARHLRAVEHFWGKLVESGAIYKGTHAGWYCVSDECFYAASQVTKRDEDGKMVSIESGNEVVWEEETNWKFRLGAKKELLERWLSKPESVHPNSIRLELLRQMANLEDLSVSRPKSRVKWGVPVPGDPDQSIYVWVDALINYLTVLGYPEVIDGWPVDVHVVGKDIVKFHAVHWPALLDSAGLQPPNRIIAHAHWTMGKSKMSKSRGNVVDPIQAMKEWSVDGVRWYLMRVGGSLTDDADYAHDQVEIQYRLLADQVGNLLSRISGDKILRKVTANANSDKTTSTNDAKGVELEVERNAELDRLLAGLRDQVEEKMNGYQVTAACASIMDVVMATNKLFTELQPWKKTTSEGSTIQALTYAYNTLRISGILLQPFIPDKSTELLDRLAVPPSERTWQDASWALTSTKVSESESDMTLSTDEMLKRIKSGSDLFTGKGYLFPLPTSPNKDV